LLDAAWSLRQQSDDSQTVGVRQRLEKVHLVMKNHARKPHFILINIDLNIPLTKQRVKISEHKFIIEQIDAMRLEQGYVF
jgi:hypothetical protein